MLAQQKVLNLNIEIIRKITPKRFSNSKMDLMHGLAPLPPPCCGTRYVWWNWGFWMVFPCLEGWRMVDYGGKGAADVYGCVGRCMEV